MIGIIAKPFLYKTGLFFSLAGGHYEENIEVRSKKCP
jgi:hypothetical protein